MPELSATLQAVTATLRAAHAQQLASKGAAREAFRSEITEALTGWRLGCVTVRPNYSREYFVMTEGVGEIAALRLTAVFLPMLHTLGRIQRNVENTAALSSNRDPYAPRKREG